MRPTFTLTLFATSLAASLAAAGQPLHTAGPASASASTAPTTTAPTTAAPTTTAPTTAAPTTTGSPESPYDPPKSSPAPPGAAAAKPTQAFGDAGSTELGVAIGVTIASDVRDLSASLAIGRFVAERFELSALASIASVKAGAQSATLWSSVIEPAYHVVLAPSITGMLGMGVGVAYTHQLGTGLAITPRIAIRFAVGHASVLTPALSYAYVTHRALDPVADLAANAVTRALRIQLGYAVTW